MCSIYFFHIFMSVHSVFFFLLQNVFSLMLTQNVCICFYCLCFLECWKKSVPCSVTRIPLLSSCSVIISDLPFKCYPFSIDISIYWETRVQFHWSDCGYAAIFIKKTLPIVWFWQLTWKINWQEMCAHISLFFTLFHWSLLLLLFLNHVVFITITL